MKPFLRRLRGLFGSDREQSEEIASNLQLHIDDNLRQGMSEQEARRQAVIKLGGLANTREAYRDQSTLPLIENLLRDVRFSLRQLRHNPVFSITCVLMLALGMGVSIAIFAFVDAALLKPLPYKDPQRLVGVFEKIENLCPYCNLSYPDYLDWKRENTVFESLDTYNHQNFIRNTSTGVERAFGTRVTDGFFRTLGVAPILGRDFRPGEDLLQAPRTVLLSYATWQKTYAGRTDVLGQTVILDNQPNTIIGVLPSDFHYAPAEPVEYWTTMHAASECDLRRSCHSIYGVARLKDGTTMEAALADVKGIAARLEQRYPTDNKGQGASLQTLSEVVSGNIRPILLVLLSGAALLLLIAAVNVASLLLVRTESRKREFAVRGSLGASAGRIASQFITEGLVLSLIGALLGLVFGYFAIKLLTGLMSMEMRLGMPYLNGLTLSPHVLVFAAAVAFASALLFAFTPSLRFSFSTLQPGLSEGSRGSAGLTWRRLGSKLVVVELAAAVVLLAGAGLLGQSLHRLLSVHLGLNPEHLFLMYVNAPAAHYANEKQDIALARNVIRAVSAIPAVTSAGITNDSPVGYNGDTTWFKIVGRPWHGEHNDTPERDVTPAYFKTIGAHLLRGRFFEESEDSSKPNVAIVNRTFARTYFPGQDVLGKQISSLDSKPILTTIVGLVDDIKEGPLNVETVPVLYMPFNQSTTHSFCLFISTAQDNGSVLPAAAAAIHAIDSDIITSRGVSMNEHINASQSAYTQRTAASLVGGFAALALLLASVGLYGVIAYSVSQRTREIGVRVALGAARGKVYAMVLKEAGLLVSLGLAAGIASSLFASRAMQTLLFGVKSWDLPTLAAVALVLAAAALAASFFPARRAASVNPVDALRAD